MEKIKLIIRMLTARGGILITPAKGGVMATRFGDFTNSEIGKYTKGFNEG